LGWTEPQVSRSGIAHLARNERDARISCTRHQTTAKCAAFIEESRMKFVNANKPHRKSGDVGHPSLNLLIDIAKAIVGFPRISC
jgi:hypothetical protein